MSNFLIRIYSYIRSCKFSDWNIFGYSFVSTFSRRTKSSSPGSWTPKDPLNILCWIFDRLSQKILWWSHRQWKLDDILRSRSCHCPSNQITMLNTTDWKTIVHLQISLVTSDHNHYIKWTIHSETCLHSIRSRRQIDQKDSICVNLVSLTSDPDEVQDSRNSFSLCWRRLKMWAFGQPCLLYRYFYHRGSHTAVYIWR